MKRTTVFAALLVSGAALGCPMGGGDAGLDKGALAIDVAGVRSRLSPADLDALPQSTLTQTQSVSGGTASAPERRVSWSGVLLRDLLGRLMPDGAADRTWRTAVFELVATDGYRAMFSWGELFNSTLGDAVIVVRAVDGRALDMAAGPLALRSLGDLRPGPRHVRNLCGIVVRR